ncbi:synaptonemal complex protein 2 [Boleophthalmus pectinirostris]|uniref:synaptonemal complex protein 2 n=1 Tax=Boleophthalmus pectinirostris TaxID=150288 RepID=UPI00242E7760|nr:synaptonemal complex protein 2 [Boleophthalmus pectinirostris]
MSLSQSNRLETILEVAAQTLHIQTLNGYLQRDFDKGITIQCSQQILNKLDKFICKSLEQGNSPAASLGFTVIYKCGKNLKLPGGQGLSALIANGLVKKMLQWFEKCRQLWVLGGSLRDELLLNLAEDFFDALMVSSYELKCIIGAVTVTESFLYPIGHIAVDPRIYILIQKEAIHKFNLILNKIPIELRKDGKILRSQEAADVMSKLASRILDGGDYDFQTTLMEALCRMATCEQRKQLADHWFTMEHVSAAFVKIRDSEFETDCRKFLNMVNGIKGDKRSVFSYPCLEVYLDKNELLMPADEKLEEFWIDFNTGSHSISFYFSLPDEDTQEGQWEIMCINENEVNSYTVKEEGKRRVLELDLSEVVVMGSVEGSSLTIHFSCGLEILPVVQNVFGHNKNTAFVGKTGTSVVKTTVKVLMENSATSQIIPESQMSLRESDKNVAPIKVNCTQMKTPAKRRLSESITYISSSGGGSARSVSTVLPAGRCKGKTSLEMVCSVERPGPNYFAELKTTAKTNSTPITARRDSGTQQNISLTKARSTVLSGPSEDKPPLDSTFVPDSQPTTGRNISSKWHKYSVSDMLMMPTQKMCSLPISVSPPSSAQKQACPSSAQQTSASSSGPLHPKHLHAKLTKRLQQVLHERNQDAPSQNAVAQKRKMSDTKEDWQIKNPTDECVGLALKEKKSQRNSKAKAKGKIKPQMEEEGVVKALGKAAEEKMSISVKSAAVLSKEKRDEEVTGNMVKHISSYYEGNSLIKLKGNKINQCLIPPLIDRPFFNMKWHTSMGNVRTLAKSNSKHSKENNKSTRQRKDVFAFSVDTPQSIGRNKAITSSTCISVTDEESRLPSTKKKEQPPPKAKRYVKKHLFSDTDTDRGTTDVSWLRESSRKPKPKVTKYPRAAPAKSKVVPALPSSSPVPLKDKTNVKSIKKAVAKPQQKKEKAAPAVREAPAPIRRPFRAAAHTSKHYKETDSDESQSESELFKVIKSDKPNEIQETNKKMKQQSRSYVEPESNNSSQSESEEEQPSFSKPNYVVDEIPKQEKKLNVRSEQAKKKLNEENKYHKASIKSCEKPVNVLKENANNSTQKNRAPVKEHSGTLKEPWAQRQVLSPPPSFIERMRSAERSGPSFDLPCSPVLSLQGSPLTVSPNPYAPSPLMPTLLLPKLRSTVISAEPFTTPSFYNAEKRSTTGIQSSKSVTSLSSLNHSGHSKACGAIRTKAVQSPVQPDVFSQSPLSLSRPLMTSTLVNQDQATLPSLPPSVPPSLPPSPLPEVHSSRGSQHSLTKMSPVSEVSLNFQSSKSSFTGKVVEKASVTLRTEKTPLRNESLTSMEDVASGPSRKRHKSYSSSNNSDEEDKEQMKKSKMRTQHSPRMKPRKLFKSACKAQDLTESWKDQSTIEEASRMSKPKAAKKKSAEGNVSVKKKSETYIHEDTVSAEHGVSQVLSSSCTVVSGHWDADVEDGEMDEDLDTPGLNPREMCREFSCKLQQKFKSRFKMVEVYNKHSLKTVQQQISTINSEVAKHRAQGLEQVQRVLLEEVHTLEQNDTVLKNMENDLTMHWNKQTVAFCSLQKHEKRRNDVLRKTLQNVCHSLEYEERVFTSQMCLIRKDMKSAQDRLLTEMHEREIQSIKRGLHALFFPDATRF